MDHESQSHGHDFVTADGTVDLVLFCSRGTPFSTVRVHQHNITIRPLDVRHERCIRFGMLVTFDGRTLTSIVSRRRNSGGVDVK